MSRRRIDRIDVLRGVALGLAIVACMLLFVPDRRLVARPLTSRLVGRAEVSLWSSWSTPSPSAEDARDLLEDSALQCAKHAAGSATNFACLSRPLEAPEP